MKNIDYKEISDALGELDKNKVIELADIALSNGEDGIHQLIDALSIGMDIVGDRFENAEYFVGDLIEASNIMIMVGAMIKKALPQNIINDDKKVILCTVENDIHDIGKNIVKTTLESSGINVIDLGVNVSAERIFEVVKNEDAKIVALSGVMSTAMLSMKNIIGYLKQNSQDIKVIIGGSCVYHTGFIEADADAWGRTPKETRDICMQWLNMK